MLSSNEEITLSSIVIEPFVGLIKPATIRKVVVFPQPEGPKKVMNSPSLIFTLTYLPQRNLRISFVNL